MPSSKGGLINQFCPFKHDFDVVFWGEGGLGGFPDMTFFNFLCRSIESVGLSEVVLESLPVGDNFNYFLFYKINTNVQNRHHEIQSCYMNSR